MLHDNIKDNGWGGGVAGGRAAAAIRLSRSAASKLRERGRPGVSWGKRSICRRQGCFCHHQTSKQPSHTKILIIIETRTRMEWRGRLWRRWEAQGGGRNIGFWGGAIHNSCRLHYNGTQKRLQLMVFCSRRQLRLTFNQAAICSRYRRVIEQLFYSAGMKGVAEKIQLIWPPLIIF